MAIKAKNKVVPEVIQKDFLNRVRAAKDVGDLALVLADASAEKRVDFGLINQAAIERTKELGGGEAKEAMSILGHEATRW